MTIPVAHNRVSMHHSGVTGEAMISDESEPSGPCPAALEERVAFLTRCAWQAAEPRPGGGRVVRFMHEIDLAAGPLAADRLISMGWEVMAINSGMVCYPPEP